MEKLKPGNVSNLVLVCLRAGAMDMNLLILILLLSAPAGLYLIQHEPKETSLKQHEYIQK